MGIFGISWNSPFQHINSHSFNFIAVVRYNNHLAFSLMCAKGAGVFCVCEGGGGEAQLAINIKNVHPSLKIECLSKVYDSI